MIASTWNSAFWGSSTLFAAASNNTETLVLLAIGAGLIATVVLGAYGANRLMRYWRYESQLGLFHGLCRVQGLDRRAKRLLLQIAAHHQLRQLGRIFTEPRWLDPAVLKQPFGPRLAEVTLLRNRLFDES